MVIIYNNMRIIPTLYNCYRLTISIDKLSSVVMELHIKILILQ